MPSEVLSDEGDGSLSEGVGGISGLTAPVQCCDALSSDEPAGEATRQCLVAGGFPQESFEPAFAYLMLRCGDQEKVQDGCIRSGRDASQDKGSGAGIPCECVCGVQSEPACECCDSRSAS